MGSDGSTETEERPATRRGRRGASLGRFVEWVKVDGDRLLLTSVLSLLIFVFVLGLYSAGVIAFTNANSVTRMASGMIAGTFSLVTLVVSVNQLILSQEFASAGKSRDRFSGVMEFRRDIEDRVDVSTAPIRPTETLSVLAEAIAFRADRLSTLAANHPDEEFEKRVRQYATELEADNEWIDDRLDRSSVEVFDALSVAVEYDDAWQISAARSLRNDAPSLSEELSAEFDELIETLRLFRTAQEHFKTVYLQRELTRFSQLTIYCGVPAVLSAVLIALLYADLGGAAININYLPYVTVALVTVVFVPLALLTAYILRTATVTRRTAAAGPMLLGETTEKEPGEFSESE